MRRPWVPDVDDVAPGTVFLPLHTSENSVDQLPQHLTNALILGGIYALLGIGLTLILGIMEVVNFTHGELYAFGGFMAYFFISILHWNFFCGLAASIVLGVLLGACIERVFLRRMRGADIDATMIVMIGCWIAMQNIELLIWGGAPKSIGTPFPAAPLAIGSISLSSLRLFVLAAAALLILGTYLLIHKSRLGKAMRATFQDRSTASLMGISVNAIYTATFALGSGLAAAAGALLGPVFVVTPQMGNLAAQKAFAIVILGGLGSIQGAVFGGFILAFAEELGASYISSGYRDAMGFMLIILVLMFKPTGLFVRSERIG